MYSKLLKQRVRGYIHSQHILRNALSTFVCSLLAKTSILVLINYVNTKLG
jgi:hypothetical protein